MDKPSAPPMEMGSRILQTSDPGFEPSPYSNIVDSQSQGNTALPPASENLSHPVMQPQPKLRASSRFFNPRKEMATMESPSGNSIRKKRLVKIYILVAGVIIVALLAAVGFWHYKEARENADLKKLYEEFKRIKKEWDVNDWNQFKEQITLMIEIIDENRHKRSIGDPFKNYNDYDFERLNEATLTLVKTLEKSGKLVFEQP